MRIAHITDLHVEFRPSSGELLNKRLLGAVNLYLLGRAAHFSATTQRLLVDAVVALAPDAVVCTGDLTATGTETEFRLARELLDPIIDHHPFVTLAGNHDVYTAESVGRFGRHFGPWANGADLPFCWPVGPVDFVAVESSHPDWLSRGQVGGTQLAALDRLLGGSSRPAVLLLHYPLRGRRGEPYGPSTRNLIDARRVEELLVQHPRVIAVWHGHEHHGYETQLPSGVRSVDPGASGYAFLPERRRTAHFNLCTFADDGRSFTIDRYAFDGTGFVPEVGGAYATGR